MTTVPPDWASVVTAVATAFTAAILLVAAIFAGVQARQARFEDHAQDVPRCGAERDADTEFACASADRVRHHAKHASGRQQQRCDAEESD